MTAEEVLSLFERCALPILGGAFAFNTCIEQTRILVDVLAHFGIAAEPIATKLHVVCREKEFQFFISGDPRDHARAAEVAKGFRARPNREGEVYGYHVVALIERRILVDLTLAQTTCPEYDFRIDPCMVQMPLGRSLPPGHLPNVQVHGISDNGVPFVAYWIGVPHRDWEGTGAWEPSHMLNLIAAIERMMREAA